MAGHKRFRAGAWRLTVEGPPDPITGKRQQVYRTVRAPNTRAGAKAADVELAKLLVEVDAQRVLPSSGVTVGQLMERWLAHRRPGWEERSPGQPDSTLGRRLRHTLTSRRCPESYSGSRMGRAYTRRFDRCGRLAENATRLATHRPA